MTSVVILGQLTHVLVAFVYGHHLTSLIQNISHPTLVLVMNNDHAEVDPHFTTWNVFGGISIKT